MRFLKNSIAHPLLAMIVAPIERLYDSSPGTFLAGIAGGFVTFIISDATSLMTMLLVASGTADTIYGRALQKQLDNYDQIKAEIGLLSKIMGIVLVLLIRGFEAWWLQTIMDGPFEAWHTNGFLAAAVALTLFVHDLKSIQEKRERFGQHPMPVLSSVLGTLDRIAEIIGAGPNGRNIINRRKSDTTDSRGNTRRSTDKLGHEDEDEWSL